VHGYFATPTTFLIDPQGRVVMKKVGEMNIPQVRETIMAMLDNKNR